MIDCASGDKHEWTSAGDLPHGLWCRRCGVAKIYAESPFYPLKGEQKERAYREARISFPGREKEPK